MLTNFEKVKMYYDNGWATKEQVAIYVVYNKITPEDYELITGDVYGGV